MQKQKSYLRRILMSSLALMFLFSFAIGANALSLSKPTSHITKSSNTNH